MPYKDHEDKLLQKARIRAVVKGLEFSITKADIIIPEYCPILHIPLFVGKDHSWSFSPTLDRINNDLGYVQGNVWVISALANQMKSSANERNLLDFAKWVVGKL